MFRQNQELVGEAFLPTLKTLFDAPSSSPLAEVKVVNVAELLVELTNARHQTAKMEGASDKVSQINGVEIKTKDLCVAGLHLERLNVVQLFQTPFTYVCVNSRILTRMTTSL